MLYISKRSLTCLSFYIKKKAITTFEDARRSDIENERLPPTSREKLDEMHRETTSSKLRNAAIQEDTVS